MLHQEFAKYINEVAERLSKLFAPVIKSNSSRSGSVQGSAAHRPVTHIDSTDISEPIKFGFYVDGSGNKSGIWIIVANETYELTGGYYEEFKKLTRKLADRSELYDLISYKCIEDLCGKWFAMRLNSSSESSQNFSDFFSDAARKTIEPLTVGIPIDFLSIQDPIRVGKITLNFLPKDFFDQYKASFEKLDQQQMEGAHGFIEDMRRRYQGVVLAMIDVDAEAGKAIEIAQSEAKRALNVLRFFSPSALNPDIKCYLELRGRVLIPRTFAIIKGGSQVQFIDDGSASVSSPPWSLGADEVKLIRDVGFDLFCTFIEQSVYSEFEKSLLTSLELFSRGIISAELHDKVIFPLVSVETLLLKDQQEPISSMYMRFAYLAATSAAERREVIELLKEAYKARSQYLHHGEQDWELASRVVTPLYRMVWKALHMLVVKRSKYTTTTDLVEAITDQMLSGSL